MNVALSQKFYQMIGGKHRSKCCQKLCVLRFLQNTARLQPYDCFTNFCIHDFGTGGNPAGNASAGRTTWFSGWQTCGRTFGDYAPSFGQTFQRKRANLDCQPGLVEGFRPSTLASTMARSFRTRPFRTHDLDDPKFVSKPTGASCWQQWLQQVFCYTRWSTTRMRFLPAVFVRCWKCRWRIGVMKWSIWV